jgi:FKBP-type peptidyl-prolyl cis-trans isomerase
MRLIYVIGLGLFAATATAEVEMTPQQQLSYSFGQNVGASLKQQDFTVDYDALALGIKEALAGEFNAMTEEQVHQTLIQFQRAQIEKQALAKRELAEKNRQQGQEFMQENAKQEGVKTTDSGLQYQILVDGSGEHPKPTDNVTVHYRGTLIDGTEFDSSYSRGEPASFALNRVIKGWTEGVQLMRPGGKAKFVIPSELAYGSTGVPSGAIGPDATLIFEVELISIN